MTVHGEVRSGWRRRVIALGVVTALLASMGAACAAPPEAQPDLGLHAALHPGRITLSWDEPEGGSPDGYGVQLLDAAAGWRDLPTTTAATLDVTELTNRTDYHFRVRSLGGDGRPVGSWSTPVRALYVDLVLPVLRIDTEGRAAILDRENYVRAAMHLDPNGSSFDSFTGTLGIRGRGNTTWGFPKKPYRLRLDAASSLMGMVSDRDWVLLANHLDKSQLRTFTAGRAGEATELPFTPDLDNHVEVVLNGRYDGLYQLTEHLKVSPSRVNIARMGVADISGTALTGGYRLEIDARLEEKGEPGFRTTRRVPVVVKDPEPATPEQMVYIRAHVQAFEDALMGNGAVPPDGTYRTLLHVPSFIDHYLVQEFVRNQDAFWSSTFFTKERGEDTFRFGPLWDFDRSIGRIDETLTASPVGFHARNGNVWVARIFEDPAFVDEVRSRWTQLRPAFAAILGEIEQRGAALRPAIDNDAARWGYTLGHTDTPDFLVDWLATRIAWLDGQFT